MFFIKSLFKKSEKNSKKIAVFFGGKSTEHDISVISGLLTLNALDSEKYEAVAVFVDKDGKWYGGEGLNKLSFYKNIDYKKLKRLFFACGDGVLYSLNGSKAVPHADVFAAINCMHGVNGEDGSLSGVLRLSGIPFVSPDIFAGAVAIDKYYTKLILKSLEIPCADYVRVIRDEFYAKKRVALDYLAKKLGFPQIVKPARLGSSIGIEVAHNENELESALTAAFRFDCNAVCEKYLSGATDVNVAAFKAGEKIKVSIPERALTTNEILTFEDKYGENEKGRMENSTRAKMASDLPCSIKMRDIAEKLYRKLDFRGIARFDFLVLGEEVYLNEINAVPGSLAYYMFCDKMRDFSLLLNELIEQAVADRRRENNLTVSFSSSVLSRDYVGAKK